MAPAEGTEDISETPTLAPVTDAPSLAPVTDATSKNLVEIAVDTPELSTLVSLLSDPAQEELLFTLMGKFKNGLGLKQTFWLTANNFRLFQFNFTAMNRRRIDNSLCAEQRRLCQTRRPRY
jgi:hypothetical protein